MEGKKLDFPKLFALWSRGGGLTSHLESPSGCRGRMSRSTSWAAWSLGSPCQSQSSPAFSLICTLFIQGGTVFSSSSLLASPLWLRLRSAPPCAIEFPILYA
jgi:hypothetical protein